MTEEERPGGRSILSRGLRFLRALPVHARRRFQIALAAFPSSGSAARVRERWAPEASADTARHMWTQARVVREYLHERVSGDRACDWVTWMLHRHARGTGLSALVLGCGEGWLERRLAQDERIGRVTGVDLSEAAVARAREEAERAGLGDRVRHAVVDLDRDALPEGPWDLVLVHDAIHHVRDLEGLFSRIAGALAADGRLLFCEYVGPRRFDYGRRREEILDRALFSLPEKYRRLPGGRGLAMRGHRTDPGELARRDPSEAVRSDAILPARRAEPRLEVLEEIPYGGSLLSPLLYELVGNFEEGNAEDDAVLASLCAREKELIASSELPSDYVVVAARKRVTT